jgi:predicted phage-related endonuclease
MTTQIIDCAQNTPEWDAARRGLVTASEFATVLAKGKGGGESLTRKKYMYKLAGERITGEQEPSFTSPDLDRGHAMEEDAASWYAFTREVELQQIGFMKSDECGGMGYSPDRLIVGGKGLLEIKTNKPSVLIGLLEKDDFPSEHVAQCQGGLFVSGYDYIDIVCFWGKMPKLVKRAVPDRAYHAILRSEITRFNDELCELVEKIKHYGEAA